MGKDNMKGQREGARVGVGPELAGPLLYNVNQTFPL